MLNRFFKKHIKNKGTTVYSSKKNVSCGHMGGISPFYLSILSLLKMCCLINIFKSLLDFRKLFLYLRKR